MTTIEEKIKALEEIWEDQGPSFNHPPYDLGEALSIIKELQAIDKDSFAYTEGQKASKAEIKKLREEVATLNNVLRMTRESVEQLTEKTPREIQEEGIFRGKSSGLYSGQAGPIRLTGWRN